MNEFVKLAIWITYIVAIVVFAYRIGYANGSMDTLMNYILAKDEAIRQDLAKVDALVKERDGIRRAFNSDEEREGKT